MLEFHIKKATRLCYKTGERLAPGATFYSVLVTEENEVVRHDYSLAAWEGAPEDALAWWKSEMPDEEGSKVNLAPDEVVLQYFQQLIETNEQQEMAFVLALLSEGCPLVVVRGKDRFNKPLDSGYRCVRVALLYSRP